jgi:uncharacterized protein
MRIFVLSLFVSFSAFTATTPTGIPLDAAWKVSLNEYAVKHVVHPSWGYSHAERNYQNTLNLAHQENISVDEEVLFAAAFLHDLGGLPGFEVVGVDHAVRSVEVGVPLLLEMGFPAKKIDAVKEIILGHIYYGPTPLGDVARLFRDADILDFMGAIGVARILAATTELGSYPSIKNAHDTIEAFSAKLPPRLFYKSSQLEGERRLLEMKNFLHSLDAYSFGGTAF